MSESRPRVPMRAPRAAMFAAVCVALAAVGHAHMSGTDIPLPWLLGAFAATATLAWTATGRRRGPLGITTALLTLQAALHAAFSTGQTHTHATPPPPDTTHAPAQAPAPANPAGPPHAAAPATPAGLPDAPGVAGLPHAPGAADAAGVSDPAGLADAAGAGMPHIVGLPHAPGLADAAGAVHSAGMHDPAGMSHSAGLADATATGMGGLADLLGMAGHGGLGMVAAHLLAGLFCAFWLARGEAALFRLAGALGATALLAARPLARVLALLRTRPAPVPGPPAQRPPYERPRRLRGAVHAHTAVRRGPPGRRNTRTTAPWPLPARAAA
ncbi:hypothetical protein AB0F18_08560 [Streptomyces sp. NPDC029216]|uniref:hypothetical protein n=1 Tax=Streptomyces sp. NPDC029216 TaxID=3154701 RepID=UPI00340E71D4